MYLNNTAISSFTLKGISDILELQIPIFLLVLLIYLLTLGGNMTILILISLDHHLHTPMYFFLANLSILDMCSSTGTLHRVIINFILEDKSISVVGCLAQMYVFSSLTCDELFILTAMSYDRYAAICNPLRYNLMMNKRTCIVMATISWMLGFIEALPILVKLSFASCYKSRDINHFFCDPVLLEELLCINSHFLYVFFFVSGIFNATCPPILTFLTYVFIISSILRMCSSISRRKAFFTCSSHLTVVMFLYLTLICQYLRPASVNNWESNKFFSLFNTAGVPMLNPMIYSLKNKDVKSAFRNIIINGIHG